MEKLNEILSLIDSYVGGSQWFVFLLLGTGLFFTIYLKFPQFRYLKHSLRIVRGKFDKEGDEGDTSHFQALTTALSGTVGTGNIAGVALAIHLGGPAALFWMLVTAALGMTTKFVEVTLSHKYREKASDGSIAGGPMFYMKNRLNMRWLAVIFAIATILSSFGTGSLPQINSISNSLFATWGINKILSGAILAVLLGLVIIGGIKRIAKVTSKLVPAMALIYFVGAFAVILYNYENIIPSFISIFRDVFTGTAAAGGFLGAGFSFAFNRGVNRGLFSNEAGQGSAPIAHAAARAHEPVSEGLVALLEPFIDTIIICSLTGLVLLSSGVWNKKFENRFQAADLEILAHPVDQSNKAELKDLRKDLNGRENDSEFPRFSGDLTVKDGVIQNNLTIIHARSIADHVKVYTRDNELYTGKVEVADGKVPELSDYYFRGRSLLHSAPLTTVAFTKSWFGRYGSYIVSIGLLLFAFSTAISWSYYGGRAMTYLFGVHTVIYYRIIYVIGFFLASFVDTTIVWTFSGITIAMMTIPNLIGILLLRKEMKSEVKNFWVEYADRFPGEKVPKG
ncbi:alanine/glycine:cation symporter family protein [Prolixibacter denitrificans]|uniref:AGCS family alanine or glycine:cation symporter n=1 Tax=Prolixibacter denitrificans TaxID=1541063 RepID=A0A2P8CCH0_9BACT|nr:amino acid carrier protein [Prolixibacter denitrificans]PSK82622.1 AGCS family alanine or glycine:cation symporter [Prolixibacter denitrificans]GET21553.1 amino acid transporter [Prolixibacter denitrificans]